MKRIQKALLSIAALFLVLTFFAGCNNKSPLAKSKKSKDTTETRVITIGYAQAGHESDWRIANTKSFETTFTPEKGYKLILDDADGDIKKQKDAVKSFIEQKVDYIVLAPNVETGWDEILTEAKNAGIPVILSDRQLRTKDETLYLCWVGGNFLREGRESVKWLDRYLEKNGRAHRRMNIVHLQGAMGSSAQKGRTRGIEEGIKMHDNWNLVAQTCPAWDENVARSSMTRIINQVGINNIDAVFAENDNMAWGAIDAIKAAGKKPGKDIIIISFDAVHKSFEMMIAGEINCDCECNPLHGPRVEEIIRSLERGETVDRIQYVEEGVFDQTNAAEILPTRLY